MINHLKYLQLTRFLLNNLYFKLRMHIPALLAAVIGILIIFSGVIKEFPNTQHLIIDDFDANLIYWIFERNYYSLRHLPLVEFWNANQFYPHLNSLAYSDSILAGQLFYFPYRFLGFSPLDSLYMTLASLIILGAFFTGISLNKINNLSGKEKFLIIFISQFSLSVTNFLGHYQLFAFQLAPAFFLLFYDYLKVPSNLKIFRISLLYVSISSFSTYFAPMAAIVCLLLVPLFYGKKITNYQNMSRSFKSQKYLIFLTALLLLGFYFVQIRPYVELIGKSNPMDWNEIAASSARVWSFFSPSSFSAIYKTHNINFGYWEKSYFPGMVCMIATAYAILKFISGSALLEEERNIYKYMTLLFLICYIISLGPWVKVFKLNIYMPFALFAKALPGFENIRAPGRFGMFFALPMGFFLVLFLRSILNSFPVSRAKRIFSYVFIMLVLYESRPVFSVNLFSVPNENFYYQTERYIVNKDPVLVLPLTGNSHLESIKNYMDQLNGSLIHKGWLVSGYGSRSTDELSFFADLDNKLKNGQLDLEDIICKARTIGVKHIYIFGDRYLNLFDKLEGGNCGYRQKLRNSNGLLLSAD